MMRKMILSMMTTLDAQIAGADGNLNWFLSDLEFEDEMFGLLRSVDGMLFGRVSYQLLAAYWPSAGAADAQEAPGGFSTRQRGIDFAHLMNSIPKIVYSRTLHEAQWGPATIVRSVDAADIARRKQEPGKDLVLFAGSELASSFAKLDLFDEYRLMVHPVVLGNGIPLFRGLTAECGLKLLRARTFSSGVVLLHYARA